MFAVPFGSMPPFRAPRSMSTLEERGFLYAIRLPANEVLYPRIDFLLTRPVGRPPKRPIIFYHDFRYQAGSWDHPRGVVAKVEWHSGERFPRVGFIVTTLTARPEGVVHFYNQRGTAEQWIKEGKYALNWTPPFLSPVRVQPGAAPSLRPGVQPGQFPAEASLAQGAQALVAPKPPGQAHQNGRPDCAPYPAHHLSVGRGSRIQGGVRSHPGPDQPIAARTCLTALSAVHPRTKW